MHEIRARFGFGTNSGLNRILHSSPHERTLGIVGTKTTDVQTFIDMRGLVKRDWTICIDGSTLSVMIEHNVVLGGE